MERFVDRFLRYVKKNTRSDESKAGIVIPSTASQMEFLEELSEELKRIGLEDVKIIRRMHSLQQQFLQMWKTLL